MGILKSILRRVIISAIREGEIKRFDADGLSAGEVQDREHFQHYGFTSRPKNGAEGIVIGVGNVLYMIAEDDRRYRIALEDGEATLFDDQGQKVHIKRDGIYVSGQKVIVDSADVELGNGALKKLIDERFKAIYDTHTHLYNPGPGAAAPTGVPTIPLDLAANATAKTKAS